MTYQEWEKQSEERGWRVKKPSWWPWRLPIVRHIRFVWHSVRLARHVAMYERLGQIGAQESDIWYVHGIRFGKI